MRVSLGPGLHSHVARRAASLAACFVLAVMTVQMAPPAAVAKAPTKTPPTAPTMASLVHKASPTEIASARTTYSDTYDCETAPTLLAA